MLVVPEAFETARFWLRQPQPGDEPEMLAAIEETWEELHMWIPWARTKPTLEELATRNQVLREQYAARTNLVLLVVDKATGAIAGGTGLHRMDWEVPRFEIGYWVRKSFHRQGVARETTAFMRDLCLHTWGAHRVEIHCSDRNLASQRVALACGFTLEARLRHHAREYLDGALGDTLIYTILA